MIERGTLCWADLGPIQRSRPAKYRPVLVVQADEYTSSALATMIVVPVTSNTSRARMPGNVFLPASATGLERDSVVSVTGVTTINKDDVGEVVGMLPGYLLGDVERGLRRVLGL